MKISYKNLRIMCAEKEMSKAELRRTGPAEMTTPPSTLSVIVAVLSRTTLCRTIRTNRKKL